MVQLSKLALLGLATLSIAHPGGHESSEMSRNAKREFLNNAKRSLEKCSEHLERRGINARREARRAAVYEAYRRSSLEARGYNSAVNTSHHSSLHVTEDTPASELFSNDPVCILQPEATIGPFWVKGELVRSDLRDGEQGVPTILDAQFINVETCEPVEGLFWDVWHANATGVYSGVQDSTNGNGDDTSNLNKTFLRGIQQTDEDGVAQFKSIFPGHYQGRATHIHVVAHVDSQVLPNNTLSGGHVAHIGQLFFDQDLISEVEATYPYTENTATITKNADDDILQTETEDTASDPFLEYALLGDSINDGIFAWVTLGVNVSASYDTSYAASLTSSGGVTNSDGMNGSGPGGAPGDAPGNSSAPMSK
uniref:ARAD1B19426p n=1 Tax=Blastobotrys adeninivorans TaxID=409370 RepID=A0A060T6K3_BLAAD